MTDISRELYLSNFDKIYDWFCNNVHYPKEELSYSIIDSKITHFKIIDVVRKVDNLHVFKVILKATKDKQDPFSILNLTKELEDIFKETPVGDKCTKQVCYVHLNEDESPCADSLYPFTSFIN